MRYGEFIPRYFFSLGFVRLFVLFVVFLSFFSVPYASLFYSNHESYGLNTHRKAPGFSLLSQSGELVSLENFKGKYVYLMFGYLSCDLVCHINVKHFQDVHTFIKQTDIKSPVFIYITMDPSQDNTKSLAKYFDQYADNFYSLRPASTRQAQNLSNLYNDFFYKHPSEHTNKFQFSHQGKFYLIDPDGNLRFIYNSQHDQIDRLFSDLKQLQLNQG